MASERTKAPRRRKQVTRKQMRLTPYFLSLLAITALLWLAAFAGAGFKGFPTPKLGLDLQGGLSMTLTATLPGGESPDEGRLEQARQIIENRVNGTGVAEPEVYVEGNNNIVVNVAGKETNQEDLREIGAAAELRFRQVTAGPAEDLTKQDPKQFENGEDGDGQEGEEDGEESSPSDDEVSASDEESSEPEEGEEGEEGDGQEGEEDSGEDPAESDESLEKQREKVYDKLGEELVGQAEMLVQQGQESGQPMTADQAAQTGVMDIMAPFSELEAEEVAALPAEMQFHVPTIGCGQLNARAPGSISDVEHNVVACDRPGDTDNAEGGDDEESQQAYAKYLMGPAPVVGEDVSTANVQPDQQTAGSFVVAIAFSGEGTEKWQKLASDSVNQNVAIVLDNEVVSAPTINPDAANSGNVQISGDFTNDSADVLAEQLKYGSLPVAFTVETIDVVSATLGLEQLLAGLLAGAIGFGLVVLYCFAYYRFLGSVVITSLFVSTALTYPMLVVLSQQIGLTLTLAGIAGFIVAIGITADAFVVMFERIKEEVKEGRSARSAVPRAWVRARRTIISANIVNFLSAVVLYFLGIGVVKGFAFALGLSTISGLILVFLFTHPLVSWISRGRVLDSPRLSGIHVGQQSPAPAATGTPSPKES